MLPQKLSHAIESDQVYRLYSLEFQGREMTMWIFMWTWEKDTFHRIAKALSDRFSNDATHELSVLGSVVVAVSRLASLVLNSGGSHVLADIYGDYFGSGYDRKLVDYPIF